jgi:hypothetical protein
MIQQALMSFGESLRELSPEITSISYDNNAFAYYIEFIIQTRTTGYKIRTQLTFLTSRLSGYRRNIGRINLRLIRDRETERERICIEHLPTDESEEIKTSRLERAANHLAQEIKSLN